MRLQQLDLLAYGKFSGRSLHFPAAPRDFHFIVGANEAGKSTTRSAILDLLYGIETRSSFDFVHAKADLKLGARIEQAGAELAFVRTKARNRTLFNPDGQPLAESALAAWLGGTDRAFFDQMFGLDHGRLEAGGQALLGAKDDIGQILFQSAAGIGSLGAVREQLAAEADALWAPRKSGGRAYYVASDALAAAEAALRASTVRTKDWVEADARLRALQARREQLRARQHSLDARRIQLERVRRVLSPLRQWHELQAELATLAGTAVTAGPADSAGAPASSAGATAPDHNTVLLLPADAARQLGEAELALAAAGREQQLHAALAAEREALLAAVQPDTRLLRHEAEIIRLAERRQQVRHHGRDIDRRRAELAGLWQQVEAARAQLGWPAAPVLAQEVGSADRPPLQVPPSDAQASDTLASEAALARQLPPLPARAALLTEAKRFERLDQARQSADAAVRERAADLAALQAQSTGGASAAGPGPTHLSAALRVALAQARSLGDLPAAAARDAALLARCQRDLAAALAGLGRWAPAQADGPAAQVLRAVFLPPPAETAARLQRRAEAQAAVQTLTHALADLAAELALRELEIQQYRAAHHPVSAADLQQARVERDGVWQSIKSGAQSLAAAAPDFEQRSGLADQLADQRHDKAHQASELQAKTDALARLQQQATDAGRRLTAQAAELAAAEDEWAALAGGLGGPGLTLSGLTVAEVEPWRLARDRVLQADAALAEAQQAAAAGQQAATEARAALAGALAAAGLAFEADAGLAHLLWLAGEAVDASVAAGTRRDELQRQQGAAAAALARQQDKAAAAQAEVKAWVLCWQTAAAAAGLAETTTVAGAESSLAVMTQIDELLRQVRELRQTRIATLQRELQDFAQDVTVLVGQAAPDLLAGGFSVLAAPPQTLGDARVDAPGNTAGDAPGHTLANTPADSRADTLAPERVADLAAELHLRLGQAQDQRKDAERLRAELLSAQTEAAHAARRLDQAQARLAPLLRQAGVGNLDALRPLIERSDQHRRLTAAASAALQAVHDGADGLTLAALQTEVANTDTAQLPLALAELATEAAAERLSQDALTTELTQAAGELAQIAGQDAAAQAESARQQALAAMATATERYLKVHTAERLLKWAIDRYRQTRQGPMLLRAGELFAALTLGSFARLTVDADSETPVLYGQRSDGSRVGTAGMSEGSRDQLYLALRLAALELQLGAGHALPFIADDLFINYDDSRARAGLAALARLSELTQVVFLSHHDHLLPLVRSVFGDEVNVLDLNSTL